MARPRINKAAPLSDAEKLARSRHALLKRGGRRITLNLTPEAATALESLLAASADDSATAVINRVLVAAAGE